MVLDWEVSVMTSGDPRIRVDADFLFEVDPKSIVFDTVRERITDAVVDEYGDILVVGDPRGAIETNTVELTPTAWHVDATLRNDDTDLRVELRLDADGEAEGQLIAYVKDEVDDRFGISPDRLYFKKISLRPGAWFVDAVYQGE